MLTVKARRSRDGEEKGRGVDGEGEERAGREEKGMCTARDFTCSPVLNGIDCDAAIDSMGQGVEGGV